MRNKPFMSTWGLIAALLATGLLVTSCKKKSTDKTDKKTADKATPSADNQARPAADQAKIDIPVNPDLEKAIKAAATTCKPNDLRNCEAFKAAKKLYDTKGKELDMFLSALVLMTRPDSKVATMAAESLSDGYSRGIRTSKDALSKNPSKLPKALVQKIIANLANIKTTRVAALCGALAGLAGLTNEFLAAAGKLPKNGPWFAKTGATHFMQMARLKAFPAVKALVKRQDKPGKSAWQVAALSALNTMRKPVKAEYAAVCPWAAGFLLSDDPKVAERAGYVVVGCAKNFDPSYLDKLLDAGKKRITEKPQTWKRPVDFPFRNPCFGGVLGGLLGKSEKMGGKPANKDAVAPACAKTYDFLAWTTTQPKISDEMKARAVMWIAYQERSAKAFKWLKKLTHSKNKAVAAEAKKQIAYLKKNYIKK